MSATSPLKAEKTLRSETPTTTSVVDAWRRAVTCLRDKVQVSNATNQVYYTLMPPDRTPANTATIIGAVYADSFWSGVKFEERLLSRALLTAGLGWSQSTTDSAAHAAFKDWHGLFLRSEMAAGSSIPRTLAYYSPDVIADGALSPKDLIARWNEYLSYSRISGGVFVYARCQSLNVPIPIGGVRLPNGTNTPPEVRVYAIPGSLTLSPPATWMQLKSAGKDFAYLLNENGAEVPNVAEFQRVATGPFDWTPPNNGHFCLVASVRTEFFTNNPASVPAGNWDTHDWVAYDGAGGWRNVDVLQTLRTSLNLYNHDARQEEFILEAHCADFPAGTKISLECNHDLVKLSSGSVNITQPNQVVAVPATLPPLFEGQLNLAIETPDGKPLPREASLNLRQTWVIPANHHHYPDAVKETGVKVAGQAIHLPLGHFCFVGGE
ncbi:MAG TPA: hypothetical protein VKZ53_30015 [Candidatus Angelobacter sp.]|nr:hypothetical protein [Candidatus Angelobacter sp.]